MKWMASILRSFGIDVGHESVGKNGMASWYMVSNDMPLGVQYLGHSLPLETLVLHQVRNPLDCIASVNRVFKHEAVMYVDRQFPNCLPRIDDVISRLKWTMSYWFYWNRNLFH